MSSPGPYPSDSFSGNYDSTAVITTICSALALYNALELILLIFTTFREFRGLYFWSLLIASFGVIPYNVGFIVEFFRLTHAYVGTIIDSTGWVMMITGQSFVLYSRLGLLLSNQKVLAAIKWMIIVDGLLFHSITTVLVFGAHNGARLQAFVTGYAIMEKIQMTAFCIQEFIISGLYVWKTWKLLNVVAKKGTRRVIVQLFIINVIIIAMDIGLLAIEYKNYHVLEQAFKGFIYSVKLKLEFAILGKLVELVQSSQRTLSNALLDADTYVDQTKASLDLHSVTSPISRPQWLADLEKVSAEHVESVGNGHLAGESSHHQEIKEDFVKTDEESAMTFQRPEQRRRARTDSDLMYAEAMRSISST